MKQIYWMIVVLLYFSIVPTANAQIDIDDLGRALVGVYIDGDIHQTGIVVTLNGHILTIPTEALQNAFDSGIPVSVRFLTGSSNTSAQNDFGVSALALDADEGLAALLQISTLPEVSGAAFSLSHFNPIVESVASNYLQRVSAIGVSPLNPNNYISTNGQINSIVTRTSDFLPGIFYRSRVTTGVAGQGGMLINADGGFIGLIAFPTQEVSVIEAQTIEAICLNNIMICRVIMESQRAEPQNRTRPASGLWQLTNGVGLTNGGRVSDGQVQTEYYCARLGLIARVSEDEMSYECVDAANPNFSFPLEAIHHDIICQQTYRNPEAIAFQINIAGVSPVSSWRCYA